MKNYLIINPEAGNKKGEEIIRSKIECLPNHIKKQNEFIYLLTSNKNDATEIAKKICNDNQNEDVNVFACGGDGTCFEVLNGIVGANNVNFGIIPVGSCNDFLKTFPNFDFFNLEKQFMANTIKADIILANNEYVLNVANFGFDARANYDQIRYRSKFKTVKKAYNFALFKNIISPKLGDKVEVVVDDKKVFSGKMLLSSIANAKFYGGGYKCAPKAEYDDGLLDICIVKKVSPITFARFVKFYKNGEHLDNPKLAKFITYLQGKKVEIIAKDSLVSSFDGETRISKSFKLECFKHQINLILPY